MWNLSLTQWLIIGLIVVLVIAAAVVYYWKYVKPKSAMTSEVPVSLPEVE